MEVLCNSCNKLFDKPAHEIGKRYNFCSRKCWSDHCASTKNKVLCDNCGRLFSKSNGRVKRAVRNYCSKECWSKRDYAYNKQFFSIIDSEDKAYWLGFVCADGWLDERDKAIGIGLQRRDRNHLLKFANAFQVQVKDYQSGSCLSSRCMVFSKTIYNDLVEKGVTPRKSSKDDVRVFDFVPSGLLNHFVRGWFDGDGSVMCNPKQWHYCLSIVGTEKVLSNLLQIIKNGAKITTKAKVLPHRSIYEVKIGGRRQVAAIGRWLYENSTICLERKKIIFDERVYDTNCSN